MRIYNYDGHRNLSGKRIRKARLQLGLSQSELATLMQLEGIIIERDSISRTESGTRFIPDYELPAFASTLKVTVPWLLGLES